MVHILHGKDIDGILFEHSVFEIDARFRGWHQFKQCFTLFGARAERNEEQQNANAATANAVLRAADSEGDVSRTTAVSVVANESGREVADAVALVSGGRWYCARYLACVTESFHCLNAYTSGGRTTESSLLK